MAKRRVSILESLFSYAKVGTLVLRRSKASLRLNILRRSLIFAARLCCTVATRLRFLDGLFDFLKWHQNFPVKFENFAKETFSSLTFWNTSFFPSSKMRRLDFLRRWFRYSLKWWRLRPRPLQPLKSKIHGRLRGRKSRIRVGSRAGDGGGGGVIGDDDPRIGGDGGVIRDVHLVIHQEHSNLFEWNNRYIVTSDWDFWPRDAKHRGPRSRKVGSDFNRKVRRNACNRIYRG